MEEFKIGDLVVPLHEDIKRVLKISNVDKALECEIEGGWEISAKRNYRKATEEEIDELYDR